MYYIKMRPEQIQDCAKRNVPLIMAAGVLEYHGPHLPIGTDALITSDLVKEIEQRCECVVAPDIVYGSTMTWSAGPEEGQVDFDSHIAYLHTKEIFKRFLAVGFRRIYVVQHHQAGGEQQIGLKFAAREALADISRTWEDGWGRYRDSVLPIPDFFHCIQVLGLDANSPCPWEIEIGHGSKGETQLMQYYESDYVDMSRLNQFEENGVRIPDWLKDSHLGDVVKAKKDMDYCVEAWIKELSGKEK